MKWPMLREYCLWSGKLDRNSHFQPIPFSGSTPATAGAGELLEEPANFTTLVSLLRQYGKSKSLLNGRKVHAHITKYSYDHNILLGNCLIDMYGNCGSLEDARTMFDKVPNQNLHSWNILIKAYGQSGSLADARAVFDKVPNPDLYSWNMMIKLYGQHQNLNDATSIFERMPHRNVVSWTAMITAFSQNGHSKEALEIFYRMQHECTKPDKVTFLCTLEACASLAALEDGRKIHSILVQCGLEQEVVVGTALVKMYGKCESLHDARILFDRLIHRDAIFWNTMITVFAQNGHHAEALELFHQMQNDAVVPDKITFVSALNACAGLVDLEKGQMIHAAIVDIGYEQELPVETALIDMYGKCGSLYNAVNVFSRMPYRDVFSWTVTIAAFYQNEHDKEALDTFHQMQLEGIKPDKFTFACAIDACASLANLTDGKKIHAMAINTGHAHDIVVGNALITMYSKCRSMCEAWTLFGRRLHKDIVSWNAMISVFVQNGHAKDALELFYQMRVEGMKPNKITFVCTLEACSSLTALEDGQMIHDEIVQIGFDQDVVVGTAIINMYGKCRSLHNANTVFSRLPHHDVISWNALIAAFAQDGHSQEALGLYHQMVQEGIKPDKSTLVSTLDACGSLAALKEGQQIYATAVGIGYEQDVAVGTALINMYGKSGSMHEARFVSGRMSLWDVVSWNALISAFAQNGQATEALDLFLQMQLEGCKPNESTFVTILTACSHTGQVEEGRHYFISMIRDHGISLTEDHYVCMVDLLGRAGHLEEAEEFIYSMPIERVASPWLCLLGACRIHQDVERAIRAANYCFESDPKDAVPFVLLSNIFAAVGRWNDVVTLTKSFT